MIIKFIAWVRRAIILRHLTRLTRWLQQHQLNDLKHLDRDTALTYLEWRGQSVGQKILDQERQAIQLHLGIKLPVIASELQHALKSRAYTAEQIELISQAQTQNINYQHNSPTPQDCGRMNC